MRLLVIQIPCYNERDQIARCLHSLPKRVAGFARIETLVIDDGSSDGTSDIARAMGADHVLTLGHHLGLAQAFYRGVKHAFTVLHADALVNFDADLQYFPEDIPKLVKPLYSGEADYVLGERQFENIAHWNITKLILQRLGTRFVSLLTRHPFNDVTTGFRAINKEAGLRLAVLTQYTYTIETLLHAIHQNLRIIGVPIQVQAERTRPSRLIRSTFKYCLRAIKTAIVTLLRHKSFEFFLFLSGLSFVIMIVLGMLTLTGIQLLGLTAPELVDLCRTFLIISVTLMVAAIMSDNIYVNRRMTEEFRYEQRLREIGKSAPLNAKHAMELTNL